MAGPLYALPGQLGNQDDYLPLITLLTDFGTTDPFVGVMKGIILGIAPGARLVDITHEIAPHDIETGARILGQVVDYFPADTIHLAVVDPQVGSERGALAVRVGKQFFVVPYNGLLTVVLHRHPPDAIIRITNRAFMRPQVSSTFHGRDIFAPVAAHLSLGTTPEQMGERQIGYHRLDLPLPTREGARIKGRITGCDRFGNLITDITRADLGDAQVIGVELEKHRLAGISRTYADMPPGAPLALWGSFDFLEVSVNGGRAADVLSLSRGDPVVLVLAGNDQEAPGNGNDQGRMQREGTLRVVTP